MNENVLQLLKERYFLSTEKTWEDLVERISNIYPDIKENILNMEFIPSSPTLMNAFTNGKRKGTLSSCFPMNIEDDTVSIFESLTECAIVTRNGGGIGLNFSKLRGSNEAVKGLDNKLSSGPLPFIKMFNSMLDGITQSGVRRGAGVALLDIDHPDILNFIEAKKDYKNNAFNRFNFSIRIPSWFYKKLEENPNGIMQVKNVSDKRQYDLIDKDGKKVTYKELWDKIIYYSHLSAEPGIFNSDIAFDRCTTTNINSEVICNPCSEFVNIPYAACSLGSINLTKIVKNKEIDWEYFGKLIEKATIFLDNTIDINNFPVDKIKETNYKIRPMGLGIMGFANLLMLLEIPYNSKEAKDLSYRISRYLTFKSMKTSLELAKKNGSYPSFNKELFFKANNRFFNNYETEGFKDIDVKELKQEIEKYGIRNSCFTSIAPTGCGIESTKIKTKEGVKSFKEIFKENNIDISKLRNVKNMWFVPIKNIFVETIEGLKRITKLYINNFSKIIELTTKSNKKISATFNHKILVKLNNNQAIWKRLDELKLGDKILIKK